LPASNTTAAITSRRAIGSPARFARMMQYSAALVASITPAIVVTPPISAVWISHGCQHHACAM